MKILAASIIFSTVLGGCFGGGKGGNGGGGQPESPKNDSNPESAGPSEAARPVGDSMGYQAPVATPTATLVIPGNAASGQAVPGQTAPAQPLSAQAVSDLDISTAGELALKTAEGPSISWGPVAAKIEPKKLVCKYSAISYSGDASVSVSWEQSTDGSTWAKMDRGDDFLLLTDADAGKQIRCSVSASDSKGKTVSKASLAIN